MQSLSETAAETLEWHPRRGKLPWWDRTAAIMGMARRFELRAADDIAATLEWSTSSTALGQTVDERWWFQRVGTFKRHVDVFASGDRTPRYRLADAQLEIADPALAQASDPKWTIRSVGLLSPIRGWVDASGEVVVATEWKLGMKTSEIGSVRIAPIMRSSADLDLLVLLAWFVIWQRVIEKSS